MTAGRDGNASPLHPLLLLQVAAGNQAVTSLLAKARTRSQPSPAALTVSREATTTEEAEDDFDPSREETSEQDVAPATGIERIREINAGWVLSLEEYELEALWSELGPEGAKNYPEDFARSIENGMEPDNLRGAQRVMIAFEYAVKTLAISYLHGNLKDIEKEEQRLGVNAENSSDEHAANAQHVMMLARKAWELNEAVKGFRKIQVGWKLEQTEAAGPYHEGSYDYVRADFTPGNPPYKGLRGNEPPTAQPYARVAAEHAQTMGALMAIASQHPSIYLALKEGKLDAITGDLPSTLVDPLAAMKSLLASGKQAILGTKAGVESGDVDWEELKLLHRQLLEGEQKRGGFDWTNPWYEEIVKDVVGDYETTQTLIDLGIGLAAACAFVFAGLSSGGLATALFVGGLGAGGVNVGRKWEKYDDLRTAAAAGTSTANELVTQDQVTAARLDLIIESAFMFLDAAGVALKGVKSVKAIRTRLAGKAAAEKTAGITRLELLSLKQLPYQEATQTVIKGVEELGVKRAAEVAGLPVEDLLRFVPPDSPVALRIQLFLDAAGQGVEPGKLGETLRAALAGGEVVGRKGGWRSLDEVVNQAIDELGFLGAVQEAGGWKRLASGLGPDSAAGKRLKAWRDGIYRDLDEYIKTLRRPSDAEGPLIKETGSIEHVTNDLDISFLGPRSAENRSAAAQFLAGRAGLSADPRVLDSALHIGLFTDPRRLHLFDEFPELQEKLAKRTMRFEEELIWNDEYLRYLAKAGKGDAGARRTAEQIAAQMAALGVRKIPGFTPLSQRAADVLSTGQDELHAAIETARAAGKTGELEQLVEQLAVIQAQLNVKEGGGYFTAGAVERFVTGLEQFPGNRLAPTAAHEYGAALDQVNKLRKALIGFEAQVFVPPATRDAAKLAEHIKDLAKHADRFMGVGAALGKDVPGGKVFHECAEEFSDLIQQARGTKAHSMQELIARDVEDVIAKTMFAFDKFDQLHMDVLGALRERAGIPGIGDLAPEILAATRQRYLLMAFASPLFKQMGLAARAVGVPIRVTMEEALADTIKGAGQPPPPAASQAR